MNEIPGYWCCVVTRDGAETLQRTLQSIFSQTLPPSFTIVVNDGSTDGTSSLLKRESETNKTLRVITTTSSQRDIRRVPVLLNLGLGLARMIGGAYSGVRYMMVTGDDNWLAPDYASMIIERMESDRRVAVASGSWLSSAGRANQMPHGAGRFVLLDFMEKVGGKYPVAYGWETWLLYKALQLGYSVKNYSDLRYEHLRPYNPRNTTGWGRGMYSLGFPSYFVFLRFAINFVWTSRGIQSRSSSVTMLAGYLSAKIAPRSLRGNLIEDETLKAFVRRYSTARLTRLIW